MLWKHQILKLSFLLDNLIEKVEFFISISINFLLILSCQSAKTSWGHQQEIPQKSFLFLFSFSSPKSIKHFYSINIFSLEKYWIQLLTGHFSLGSIIWMSEQVYEDFQIIFHFKKNDKSSVYNKTIFGDL